MAIIAGELLVAGKAIIIVFSDLSARAPKKVKKEKRIKSSILLLHSPGPRHAIPCLPRELPLTFLALAIRPMGKNKKKKRKKIEKHFGRLLCRPVTCLDFPPNPEKMFPTPKKEEMAIFFLCVYKVRSPKVLMEHRKEVVAI